MTYPLFREGLSRCNILLNRKTLADLAIWEPRTFKVLLFNSYWPGSYFILELSFGITCPGKVSKVFCNRILSQSVYKLLVEPGGCNH
jgi:hypothetical protein